MYKIALCEDEKIFCEEQNEICCAILKKHNIEYHITTFASSAEFLRAFSPNAYNLILLDIMMEGMNGIALAHSIRESDRETTIIFITSNPDYALEGYDVNAMHYLMKPVDSAALERLVLSDYRNKFQNQFFVFTSAKGKIRVPIREIISLETVGRRVAIALPDRTVYYNGKLTQLLELLPKRGFIRCHQAFAVNLPNIRELTKTDAITIKGDSVPISRSYIKDVQKEFMRQMRDG